MDGGGCGLEGRSFTFLTLVVGAGCQCLSPIYRRRGDNKGAGGWIDELCLAKDNTNK